MFSIFILYPSYGGGLIGYGSSTSTLTSKNQENIYMGFELGLKEMIGSQKFAELIVIEQDRSGSQLGSIDSLKKILKKNVVAVFGYSGSHDSILVGKYMKDRSVLTIVPGSNHNELKNLGPTVFTTGHSMDEEVNNTFEFINKKFGKKKGFAIFNKYAVASSSIDELLKKKSLPNISKIYLTRDFKLTPEDIKKIKTDQIEFLYFSAYPEAMINVVHQLEENGIDLPVVAASSWGLGDSDLMRRFIANKKKPIFVSTEWNRDSKESKHFTSLFRSKYGREPTPENALGYDLGIIAGTTINRVRSDLTRESMVEAFKKYPCFSNLSVGKICFDKKGGHSNVKPHFYKYSLNGYIVEN